MKSWIQWEETNMHLRPYKCCRIPKWTTNSEPECSYSRFGAEFDQELIKNFSQRFGATMLGLARDCNTAEINTILEFIDFLNNKGISSIEMEIAKVSLKHILNNQA